ncbi:MAG: Gx transporter family protein [Patescibacteria group bacterium]
MLDRPAHGRRLPRLARLGALLALGLALYVMENLLLPIGLLLPLPGARLGLANLATLAALALDGLGAAVLVSVLRVAIGAAFGGTVGAIAFWLSLGGALASLCGMGIARKLPGAGLIGISIAGAVFHNLGQLAVLGLVMPGAAGLYLLPCLILLGIPAGLVTGILARRIVGRFKHVPTKET